VKTFGLKHVVGQSSVSKFRERFIIFGKKMDRNAFKIVSSLNRTLQSKFCHEWWNFFRLISL